MDAQAAVADAKAAAIHAKEKIGDLHKDLQKKMKGTKNWVTNSDYFKSAVKQAFEAVDLDNTNSVDFKELYAAVLMLYLKVTKIVRGATPPTAQDIQKLMDEVDTSGTGSLDLDGFTTVCFILFENIAGRVALQALFSFIIAPMLATLFIRLYCYVYPPHWVFGYIIPAGIPSTILTTIIITAVVPYALDLIDEYHVHKAKGRAERRAQKDHKAD